MSTQCVSARLTYRPAKAFAAIDAILLSYFSRNAMP
jgi:hypothetical protein